MSDDALDPLPEAVWIQVAATIVRGALDVPGSVPADEARGWLDALTAAALDGRAHRG